jgi:hypothetical protein
MDLAVLESGATHMENIMEMGLSAELAQRGRQDSEPLAEAQEDAYFLINRESFQENFNVLMGHYQSDQRDTRAALA